MSFKEIEKLLLLLKKCINQPILFQKLYSHLNWVMTNEIKKLDLTKYDQISQTILHGILKTKSPLEKQMLEFLRAVKKSKNNIDIYKVMVIVCYFINQDTVNFLALNELINNFVFKNKVLDYLICKYLTNSKIGIFYGTKLRQRIQSDIITSFLLQCKSKKMNFASKCILMPVYMIEKVEPFIIEKEMLNNVFSIRILEAFHFYATYIKQTNCIQKIIPSGFAEIFESYGNKKISDTDGDFTLDVTKLWIENNEIIDEIKRAYDNAKNKAALKAKLIEVIKSLN